MAWRRQQLQHVAAKRQLKRHHAAKSVAWHAGKQPAKSISQRQRLREEKLAWKVAGEYCTAHPEAARTVGHCALAHMHGAAHCQYGWPANGGQYNSSDERRQLAAMADGLVK